MEMVNLTINGKEITAPAGSTILEAARSNGIYIPTLCYDEAVEIYGACGLCVVEAQGVPKLLRSCSSKVSEGMESIPKAKESLSQEKSLWNCSCQLTTATAWLRASLPVRQTPIARVMWDLLQTENLTMLLNL